VYFAANSHQAQERAFLPKSAKPGCNLVEGQGDLTKDIVAQLGRMDVVRGVQHQAVRRYSLGCLSPRSTKSRATGWCSASLVPEG